MTAIIYILYNMLESSRCNSYCRSCCVPYKGAILLLIWAATLHSVFYYGIIALYTSVHMTVCHYIFVAFIIISIARVVTYLLYPVAGLWAELYCSRYKVMIVGNVIAVIGGIIVVSAIIKFESYFANRFGDSDAWEVIVLTALTIGIILHQFGLGLVEANTIQFGVDQLLFASNNDLSKFVSWYYWAITFLLIIPGYYHVRGCALFIIASLFCSCCRRHYMIEPVGRVNPVKHIVKVLQYARSHTAPVLRSAFTYGEGPPSRLDLAKERYGGPYTTEEVEDVKSFSRILLVLLSQFGIQLIDGMSLFDIKLYYLLVHASTSWNMFSILTGVKDAWAIVTFVTIPIYMVVIRPYFERYIPNMMKRMGISLLLAIISMSFFIPVDFNLHRTSQSVSNISEINIGKEVICFGILAQIFGALAYLLNLLTALEFILAQAPRNMQGLLIGIWYAYQGVAVLVQLATVTLIKYKRYSCLLSVIKLPIAVASFIVYVIISHWYRYRERNELSDINQQNIIEEYTERQLLRQQSDSDISYNSLVIGSHHSS